MIAEPGQRHGQRWTRAGGCARIPDLAAQWTPAQLGSVLIHHVCHLLRTHARAGPGGRAWARRGERTWVRAADAEINDDLVPAGLELPWPARSCRTTCGPGDGLLAEQYFDGMPRPEVRHPGAGEARERERRTVRPKLNEGSGGRLARLRQRRGRGAAARRRPGRAAGLAGRTAAAAGRAGRHRARQAGRDRAGRAAALGGGDAQPEGRLAAAARGRAAPGRGRGRRGGRLLLPAAVAPFGRRGPRSCSRRCGGRCPRSRWSATPRAA